MKSKLLKIAVILGVTMCLGLTSFVFAAGNKKSETVYPDYNQIREYQNLLNSVQDLNAILSSNELAGYDLNAYYNALESINDIVAGNTIVDSNYTNPYMPSNDVDTNQTVPTITNTNTESGDNDEEEVDEEDEDDDDEDEDSDDMKTYMIIGMATIGGLVLINLIISIVILTKTGKEPKGE